MNDQLLALFNQIVTDTIEWAPRIFVMLILIVVGFAVAWIGQRMATSVLGRLQVNRLLARIGLDDNLERFGVSATPEAIAGRIAFWLIVILFARAAADVLELEAISGAIANALGFVPNVVAAVLILVIGSAIARLAGRTVRTAAENQRLQFAAAMGSLTSGFVLFVLAMMAVAQLRVDTEMVQLAAGAILAGLALGFGLAFGLGSREVFKSVLAGFYARQILTVGKELEIGGSRGTLVSITSTQLLLETEDDHVTVPNSVLLEQGGRQPKS